MKFEVLQPVAIHGVGYNYFSDVPGDCIEIIKGWAKLPHCMPFKAGHQLNIEFRQLEIWVSYGYFIDMRISWQALVLLLVQGKLYPSSAASHEDMATLNKYMKQVAKAGIS